VKNNLVQKIRFYFWSILTILSTPAYCQTYDTISNWDGITQDWVIWAGGSQIITNPHKEGINLSDHCLDVVSSSDMYDLMFYNMPEPADFENYPRYNLKIYAPPGGGDIVLKFENYNTTSWQEILLTPTPGQWNNLEFNFAGLYSENYTRMVIFFDILGTVAGNHWYIDDIVSETPSPVELQSNLPIVVINTFGSPIPDEPKINASMGIIDNGPGNINNLTDPFNDYNGFIGIETRGQSTQMFPKKSYAVETRDNTGANLDASLLGMPAENDWILYAPYTDKSMLRNVVTFDMCHKMGRYCTRTIYCELVVNSDYKGVYVLEEKIKKDENRVNIATLNPDEISGDDLTGGYILSVDKLASDFQYGDDGWKSDPNPPYPNAMDITFQYYYPKPDEIVSQQRTYIKNYITTAENTLTGTSYSNPETGYNKYFDVASFVDFMLLSEISKEVDKYRYSTYFYKEKDSDGGKLFAGPAWDFNLGYGNVDYWPMGIDYTGWLYTNVQTHSASIMFWWKRLNEDAYFRNLAKTRWISLRQGELSNTKITSVIDSILVLIDEAKDRNYQRWPILGQYVWPNYDWQYNTYEDEVDYFENFLFQRLLWMDYNMPGSILQPWLSISAEGNKIRMNLYGDYFSKTILASDNFTLNDAPAGMYIQNVEYTNASECIITVSADLAGVQDLSVTISEKIINTYQNLTSNKLSTAGTGSPPVLVPEIKVFEANNQIHIRCNKPELLPEQFEILNITGQRLGIYTLDKISENSIPHHLASGLYFIVINIQNKPEVHRIAVVN
jgi:hypothetical protein